jgi:hypothetical protein
MKDAWWRCPIHNVLVRTGQPCSACLPGAPGAALKLRGERLEDADGKVVQRVGRPTL